MKFARTGSVMIALAFVVACSGSKSGSGFGDNSSGSGDGSGSGSGGNGSGGIGGSSGDGGATGPCVPDPGNYEIPGDGCDNDGDGTVDNVPTCDTGLSTSGTAGDFVKAMGICQMADGTHWGLVSATYTNGFGTTAAPKATQHGILTGFGTAIKPQEGASLGALSTGYASNYDDEDNDPGDGITELGQFKSNSAEYNEGGAVPAGFPKAAGSCTIASDVHDVMDVKLQLKVPNNAQGIAFDFDFYSGEWPDFICSKYNDGFIAYLTSAGFNGGTPDNISFDSKNDPVSVNNGFFDRCTAGVETGCASCLGPTSSSSTRCPSVGTSVCAGGTAELAGTGFADPVDEYSKYCTDNSKATSSAGGATGWLTSQAPVKAGETITIEFMIWNTGDENYDSSVLLDHLTWVPGAVVANTNRPR